MADAEQEEKRAEMGRDAPKRRPGGRSARIRAAVQEAVMEMLRERGSAEDVRVAEVAARVGVPESTIYRRWRSRAELLVDTVMAHMQETIPLPNTGSFRADLRAFLCESAAFLQSPEGALLTRSMFVTLKDEESKIRQEYWLSRFSHTGVMVRRAIERGEVAPNVDPSALLTMLTGALYVRLLVLDEPLDEAFLEQMATMVLEGVLKK